jgi:hypothetical protein
MSVESMFLIMPAYVGWYAWTCIGNFVVLGDKCFAQFEIIGLYWSMRKD